LLIFALLLGLLVRMRARRRSFSVRVFTGLGLGILFGVILHLIYGPTSEVLQASINWFNLVGQGYVRLLQMVVIPLVFISIVTAFTKLELTQQVGRVSTLILVILVGTTAVAAAVGIASTGLFGLDAGQIQAG